MPVKISQLPTASLVTSDDLFPLVDSGSLTTQKASAQQVLNYITGSTFNILNVNGNANISGNLIVDGRITAQEFYTENISASIIFESGSTKFGNDSSDTHEFSGSVLVSGTLNVNNTITGINGQFTTVSGSTGLFNIQTSSNALFTGDIRVLGTASIGQLNTVNQTSLVIGDKYITILSGGVDHAGINGAGFLWGTSSGPGETTGALGEHAHILYDASSDALKIFPGLYVTGNTTLFGISGTTAQFTTITASNIVSSTARFTTLTASNANISGNLVIDGPVNLAQFPDYAYVLYTASFDKIVVYPGLYVSGNLTGSGLGAFQTVSGSTGLFTTITASNISASNNIIAAGNLIVNGGQISSSATTLTVIAGTTVDIKDNTIITGNLTVTGIISGSSYLGVSGGGGTPGGTNTTLQFNSGSAFSGSTRLSWDYVANTLFVSGSTNISGTLTATAKSFDIAHPTRDGMRLRYGSLEGPENGVYVRGVATSNIIELPEHWTGLVHEDSITVNLTPFGSRQNIWVDKVENNKVYINGDLVKCYFTVFAERKDISKLVVEY